MIILYDKNHAAGEGLGVLTDFIEEPTVTQRGATFYETKFSYFLHGKLNEHLKRNNTLKVKVSDEQYLPFTIYEVEPDYVENTIYITAELTFLHELKNRVVKAFQYDTSIEEALRTLTANTNPVYSFVLTGDSQKPVYLEWQDGNAFDLYAELIELSGVEVTFTERGINIGDTVGTVFREPIRESDYVTKMTVTQSHAELVNRIIPVTTLQVDEPMKDEATGNRYRRETIEKITYGKPVLSPNIGDEQIRTQFVEYQNEVKDEKIFTYQLDDETEELELNVYRYETVDQLDKEAATFFDENIGIDLPKTNIDLQTLGLKPDLYGKLKHLNVYDVVPIYSESKDVAYEVQVMERTYEPMTGWVTNLKFTNESMTLQQAYRNVNAGKVSAQALAHQRNEQNNRYFNKLVNYVYNQAGQRLEFGRVLPPPDEYKEGDVYFLETADGDEMYKLVNGTWVYKTGWNFGAQIEALVKEMQKEAEKLAESEKRAEEELNRIKSSLAELDESIQNFDFENSSLDELRAKIEEASTRSLLNAEIIGGDGVTRYNKNLLKGDTRYTVPFNDPVFSVVANGGGFKAGQTYTISFNAICELLEKSKVVFTFERPNN